MFQRELSALVAPAATLPGPARRACCRGGARLVGRLHPARRGPAAAGAFHPRRSQCCRCWATACSASGTVRTSALSTVVAVAAGVATTCLGPQSDFTSPASRTSAHVGTAMRSLPIHAGSTAGVHRSGHERKSEWPALPAGGGPPSGIPGPPRSRACEFAPEESAIQALTGKLAGSLAGSRSMQYPLTREAMTVAGFRHPREGRS